MRCHVTSTRIALIKKKKTGNSKGWQGCGEIGTLIHNWYVVILESSLKIPQKFKHRVTIWSGHSTHRYILKRHENTYSHKNLHTYTHSTIILKISKVETTQIFIKWWIDKQMWYIHTVEYYLATKKGMLTWMTCKNITLSDINLSQKATYCMILLIWNVQNSQVYRDRKISDCQMLKKRGNRQQPLVDMGLLLEW